MQGPGRKARGSGWRCYRAIGGQKPEFIGVRLPRCGSRIIGVPAQTVGAGSSGRSAANSGSSALKGTSKIHSTPSWWISRSTCAPKAPPTMVRNTTVPKPVPSPSTSSRPRNSRQRKFSV